MNEINIRKFCGKRTFIFYAGAAVKFAGFVILESLFLYGYNFILTGNIIDKDSPLRMFFFTIAFSVVMTICLSVSWMPNYMNRVLSLGSTRREVFWGQHALYLIYMFAMAALYAVNAYIFNVSLGSLVMYVAVMFIVGGISEFLMYLSGKMGNAAAFALIISLICGGSFVMGSIIISELIDLTMLLNVKLTYALMAVGIVLYVSASLLVRRDLMKMDVRV